jgi:hypothetical protein
MTPNNETKLNSMRKSALDHMIFPIVSREQMAEGGPRIFARGGYVPAGAVATRPDIADAIPVYRNVHTYSGHAGAMAACLKRSRSRSETG